MRTARSLTISRRILHMPPQQPCTPPHATPHAAPATMHAPQQPCMPPGNHECPPATTYAPWQPHMPPGNHACPPSNHACPPATTHAPPMDRITDTCKNITFPQLRLRVVKMLNFIFWGNKTFLHSNVLIWHPAIYTSISKNQYLWKNRKIHVNKAPIVTNLVQYNCLSGKQQTDIFGRDPTWLSPGGTKIKKVH